MKVSSYSGQPSSKGSTITSEYFFGGAGGQRLSRYRFDLASLGLWTYLTVELIPERVGLTTSIELFRNVATAEKSLPKNTSQKCNRTPARHVYCTQTQTQPNKRVARRRIHPPAVNSFCSIFPPLSYTPVSGWQRLNELRIFRGKTTKTADDVAKTIHSPKHLFRTVLKIFSCDDTQLGMDY